MSALQSYIRRNAAHGRDTEMIGPFLATFSQHSDNRNLNYAIPVDGASPKVSDVDALTAAYQRRNLLPRLEFLPDNAPDVEAVLLAGGYTVERRIPVMTCPPGAVAEQPAPAGIELLVPESDEDFAGLISAQNEAYGESGTATPADVARMRDLLARGGFAVLARNAETGEAAGGGAGDVLTDGLTELVGFGVRAKYRRRGICAAFTEFITLAAHRAGADMPFLTPGTEVEARLYAKVGFRGVGDILHLIRE
ncbi:GNAT family N-acetyltransferase [Amycolatopsis nigrescens]|uniref:GNAT family N-acetyltransferase n=1 Tax=Amycolatopsis nigrescens TaxID=381445 RepID=UPI00035E1837|nr:N-acetyltransferase [Amycolatopsis nigrescens]